MTTPQMLRPRLRRYGCNGCRPIEHGRFRLTRRRAEQNDDEQTGDGDRPTGWFEAQKNAEASKRDEDKTDDENT